MKAVLMKEMTGLSWIRSSLGHFLTAFLICNCRSRRSSILNYDGNGTTALDTFDIIIYI
jgi:hypothetical protein